MQDFLIAQSAKDCSIMISMALASRAINLDATSGVRCVDCLDPPCVVVYRVALVRSSAVYITCFGVLIYTGCRQVDFDVKERERIPQYYEQDREVLKIYREENLDFE